MKRKGRRTIGHKEAATMIRRLPYVPSLRHLRAVAEALADADAYQWAGSMTAVSLRNWLAQFFRTADLGRTGVAEQLAQALDDHGRSRSEGDRLFKMGLDAAAAVYRERQEAAWRKLTRVYGIELRNRVD